MYGYLWRHLPGPWFARIGELLVLAVALLALLFFVVFPVVGPHLPFNDVTVQQNHDNPNPTPTTTPAITPSASPAG